MFIINLFNLSLNDFGLCEAVLAVQHASVAVCCFNTLLYDHISMLGYVLTLPPYSQGLANDCVISKVNGELYDIDRPLESDCSLELLKFDDEEAKAVCIVLYCIVL